MVKSKPKKSSTKSKVGKNRAVKGKVGKTTKGNRKRLTWDQTKKQPTPRWATRKKKKPRKDPPKRGKWVCYTIKSGIKNATYVGKTNDLRRRIRQHNGELKGGAKKTKGKGPWTPFLVVKGFNWEHHCLQFEWALQHPWDKKLGKRIPTRGITGRCKVLEHTLAKDKFTTSAPKTNKFTLQVHTSLSKVAYCKKVGISTQQFAARRAGQPFVRFVFERTIDEMKESIRL